MSEFKGTPGPWVTCHAHGAIENGYCVQEMATGRERMIANCCHYVSREEIIANARLIAAAPELLDLVISANLGATGSHTVAWQEKAQEAIAKALGK